MEVLNVEPIVSSAVAAAQNIGLIGSLAVVAVACFLEGIGR